MSKLTEMDSRVTDWRSQLAEATGKWAFVLSLSKRMVFFLTLVRDGVYNHQRDEDANHYEGFQEHRNHFIGGMSSLRSRGLVEPVFAEYTHNGRKEMRVSNYKLTPAGDAVCRLCEYVGLMPAEKPKQKRRAA